MELNLRQQPPARSLTRTRHFSFGKVQRRAPLLENKLGRTQVFKAPPEYPWHQRLRQVPLVSKSESGAAGRGVESPSGDFLAWQRGGEG